MAHLLSTPMRSRVMDFDVAWPTGVTGGGSLKPRAPGGIRRTVHVALRAAAATRLGLSAGTFRGRRLALSTWLRLTRWEYWPPWVLYAPVAVYAGWLMLKHRSATVFTASNPAILAGGFVGESKIDILRGLASRGDRLARSALIEGALPPDEKSERVRRFMSGAALALPVVLKPNEGQRGSGVVIARTPTELASYLRQSSVDTIVQEYVAGPEFGVFYYRRPSEPRGRIFSITGKELPFVVGDGRSTIERLILRDGRTLAMARFHLKRHRERLQAVPAAGERVALGDLGTHCRGALFRDASALCTPALEQAFDEIARSFDGFYFGRFDVRADSVDAFRQGQGFKVIELNGVTSEATHIYDPAIGLRQAYGVLFEQWRLAFAIGEENVRRGAKATSIGSLVGLLARYRRISKRHLEPAAGWRHGDAG